MVDVNLKVPAFEKIVDYVASGIGAVAGPMLAPWKARQAAKAKRIEANAEADSLRLIAEAQASARCILVAGSYERERGSLEIDRDGIIQRIEFQEKKRQSNIASVVGEAAALLGDKEVPDHWTARFFACVQDVSTEDMQRIWARILSGEVESPGRTSLRTLSILKDMSQKDAKIFSNLMEYQISGMIFTECYKKVRKDVIDPFVHLLHIGLIYSSMAVHRSIFLNANGRWLHEYHGHLLVIEGSPHTEFEWADISTSVLTPSGEELARYCIHEPNIQYLAWVARAIEPYHCTLKLARIVSRTPDEIVTDTVHTIEPGLG